MGFFSSRTQEQPLWPPRKVHASVPSVGKLADTAFSRAIRLRFASKGAKHPDSPGSSSSQDGSDFNVPPPVPRKNDHGRQSTETRDAPFRRMSVVAEEPKAGLSNNGTATLAQRLNDLAAANAEGRLDNDEYRELRQNLFHTFAVVSEKPVEAPVVKTIEEHSSHRTSAFMDQSGLLSSQPRSQTPSLRSHTSIASSMSNLFQRRKRESIAHVMSENDQGSIISSPLSGRPNFASSRVIRRQASNSSITTARSNHIPHDLCSISSKRSLKSAVTSLDLDGPPRSTTRSLRGEPPPSAFHASHHALPLLTWAKEPEASRSAAEIRAEIAQTEHEQRTVLAALTGTRATPSHVRSASKTSQVHATKRRSLLGSHDGCINEPLQDHNATITSIRRTPSPSTISPSYEVTGAEVSDMHYRQIEIEERYRQRLDYLRARLKGAELHERLVRR